MKAAVLVGAQQFMIKDVPQPVPGAQEVMIKVRACAICGSDLTVYKLGFPERVLGHELAGDIAEVGSQVKDWNIGDRVVVEPSIVCGECYWCQHRQYNLCDSLGYTGLATDGALAEFVRVPAYQLHRLPERVSYEQGALVEPLAVALRGVQMSQLASGESAAVFGCGAVGLFAMLWARNLKAGRIIATDVVQSRLDAAKSLADIRLNPTLVDIGVEIAALTDNLGPHVIFECSGSSQAQLDAINAARKGGRIILLGIGYEPAPVTFMQITTKEITLKGSLGYSTLDGKGEFSQTIQAIAGKEIDPLDIPVQTFGLNEVGPVFEALSHGEIAKAIIYPE